LKGCFFSQHWQKFSGGGTIREVDSWAVARAPEPYNTLGDELSHKIMNHVCFQCFQKEKKGKKEKLIRKEKKKEKKKEILKKILKKIV
jgi:hypothetical protein